jgi:hypothetical protein
MEDLSIKELKDIAKSKGLNVAKNATKEQVIALLNGQAPVVAAAPEKTRVYLGKCVNTGEPLFKDI